VGRVAELGSLGIIAVNAIASIGLILTLFGGLFYWPTYMVVQRRWSSRARRLLVVFLFTLGVDATLAVFFWFMWEWRYFGYHQLPLLYLFPLINLASLVVSWSISRRAHDA
jgi:uncharacterized membrane protein YhaH (DUF805 family)